MKTAASELEGASDSELDLGSMCERMYTTLLSDSGLGVSEAVESQACYTVRQLAHGHFGNDEDMGLASIFITTVQEKIYVGPVLKKEFHFNNWGGRNQSFCAKTAARLEWDTANMKVGFCWLQCLGCGNFTQQSHAFLACSAHHEQNCQGLDQHG
jgi:hypothetical protein